MTNETFRHIALQKVVHDGDPRIGLFFEYHWPTIVLIKSLPNRKYSFDDQYWHLPYTRESLEDFQRLNLEYQVKRSPLDVEIIEKDLLFEIGTSGGSPLKRDSTNIEADPASLSVDAKKESIGAADIFSLTSEKISFRYSDGRFEIRFTFKKAIVDKIKPLRGAWWSARYKAWIVKGTIENLNVLQKSFSPWETEQFAQLNEMIRLSTHPKIMTLYRLPESEEQIAVQLSGYGIDVETIKSLPQRSYQKAFKRWVIRNDKKLIERLIEHYTSQGVKIINRLPSSDHRKKYETHSLAEKQRHLIAKFDSVDREIVEEVTNALIQLRYSWKTVTAYTGPIIKFKSWLNGVSLKEATTADVNRYLADIARKKVSESLIHRHVNALKFYFTKVILAYDVEIEQIRRPKKSLHLPRILSVSEVGRMIEVTENLKHRTLLYALYASGLRLSELTNLQLQDIKWDRNQLFVKGGKGKKDRVVMLSEVLKESFKLYCNVYKPMHYAFEGAEAGKPYSGRSIQQVVKNAAKKAGISQRVTPHTLRHCFATHLHDGGVSIKLIQELLGHANIKTTLIYTHVSTDTVSSVTSPLDNLQLTKKRNLDTGK